MLYLWLAIYFNNLIEIISSLCYLYNAVELYNLPLVQYCFYRTFAKPTLH